jgi:hypothetical protein
MRVLFLDFDGVLHPAASVETRLMLWCWVPLLERLLDCHDDVGVVVHSTWRYNYDLDELRLLLSGLGPRVIDSTPRAARWDSIEWWISQNYKVVTSWRVLDDALHEFPTPVPPQLIACDPSRGVSAPEVQTALRDWLRQ